MCESVQIFQYFRFSLRTTEENVEFTTWSSLQLNSTEPSSVSPPVTHILQEIFRTHQSYCWRRTYNRGVGRPLHTCPDHVSEQDGLLCYPPCRDGYNGVGPVCWEKCDNLTSFGFVCVDISLPERRSCPWYDKCGISRPSCLSCPMNYTKFTCLCGRLHLRGSYGRGAGVPLICSKKFEQNGALCYEKCDRGYHGIGPVCWQTCSSSHPYSCVLGCSKNKEICHEKVKTMIRSVIISSLTILHTVIGLPPVTLKILTLLASAKKGEWQLVAKDFTDLAGELTDRILPELIEKFAHWPLKTIESATKNASLILTATAMRDQKILNPILKYFYFNEIEIAFNHGKCELEYLE